MPDLPIADGDGSLLPFASLYLLAHMAFPQDRDARNALIVWNHTDQQQRESAEHTVSSLPWGAVRVLMNAPLPPDMFRDFGKAIIRGSRAGFIFVTLSLQAKQSSQEASVNRAVKTSGKLLGDLKGCDNVPLEFCANGHRKLWDDWTEYRSVAHLWAAYLKMTKRKKDQPKYDPFSRSNIEQFLRGAEYLRAWGEWYTVRGQQHHHGPVLDPKNTWRVPSNLGLGFPSWAVGLDPLV